MFGRKTKSTKEDLENIRKQVLAGEAPPQIQEPEQLPQQSAPQQPARRPVAKQPPKPPEPVSEKTFLILARRKVEQRDRYEWSPTGQQIRTGELELVETIEPIYNLSVDDVMSIVRSSASDSDFGQRIKELLKDRIVIK